MSKASWEMDSIFSDASNTDYDNSIELTRKKMKGSSNPCESHEHLATLVARLIRLKSEYYSRPLPEGYCLGLFTPHKSRIQKRIDSLESERDAFSIKCKHFLRHEELENNNKIAQARLDAQERMFAKELEARSKAETTTVTNHTTKGVHEPTVGSRFMHGSRTGD